MSANLRLLDERLLRTTALVVEWKEEGMEVLVERCAGLDVHKDTVAASELSSVAAAPDRAQFTYNLA